MHQPPETITRFYGNVDFALDVIRSRQIAFVHVSKLNDPFDPYCFFETDFGASYAGLIRFVQQNHPRDLRWFRAHVTPVSWGRTVHKLKVYLENLKKNLFVLSTSAAKEGIEPKDNLYMWGHYAQGHHGIAIEFDAQALAKSVADHQEAENQAPFCEASLWAKIEYVERFAPISAADVVEFLKQEKAFEDGTISNRSMTALGDYYSRMSVIKSTVWEREAEWRLMWRRADANPPVYKCPIGAHVIRRIYLGLEISAAHADKVIAAAQAAFPSVPILRARKRPGDLALDFETVI